MSSGIDANDGGMLTQEALDAMLAAMGPEEGDDLSMDTVAAEEPIAGQATKLAQESVAAAKESAQAGAPSLSFLSFNDVHSAASDEGNAGFERVQDISLEIAVELGRTRLLIKDILELTSGSIIELEKRRRTGRPSGERTINRPRRSGSCRRQFWRSNNRGYHSCEPKRSRQQRAT